ASKRGSARRDTDVTRTSVSSSMLRSARASALMVAARALAGALSAAAPEHARRAAMAHVLLRACWLVVLVVARTTPAPRRIVLRELERHPAGRALPGPAPRLVRSPLGWPLGCGKRRGLATRYGVGLRPPPLAAARRSRGTQMPV